MSGFSTDWLDARESWDHAARAEAPTEAAIAFAKARTQGGRQLRIVDLGSGSGSNHRYLAPRLAQEIEVPQFWRLIENNIALLEENLIRRPDLHFLDLECIHADLVRTDMLSIVGDADLVTCSALLDLVSEAWLHELILSARAAGAAVLTAMSWDGTFEWADETDLDREINDHFNQDQRRDKGFGPALGPTAPDAIHRIARNLGIDGVIEGESPWPPLDRTRAGFDLLVDGWAAPALAAADPGRRPVLEAHAEARKQTSEALLVGHRDHFIPPRG